MSKPRRLTQEQQLERYRLRIGHSKKWRANESYDKTWKRLRELYGNKHFEGVSQEDRIAVNISFATINVIYPSISVNHPKTTVMARDPEDNDKAIIAEAVLDYWWKAHEVGPEFRRAVKDFLIIGHGWVKTGYKFAESEQARPQDQVDADFAAQADQADQYAAENPDMAHTVPSDDEIMASIPTTHSVVVEDRPFVERVSPHDVFVDPEATSMNDISWIAQRIVKCLEDVKDDDRYDAQGRNNVGSDVSVNEQWVDERAQRRQQDDIKRVTIWEFYDLKRKTMCVFSENGKGFLVKPTAQPYKFGHPFVMIRNYDVPDQFYPLGDLEAIEPLQRELNKTRSQLMNMRKQFARKSLYYPGAFDAAGRAALESDRDGEMVPVQEGSNYDLKNVVMPFPTNNVAPELFNYTQAIEQDINTVTGVSDYQRGASSEIRRTATEASMIQDAVNARSADKLAIVEAAVAHIGGNMLCLARQYLTGAQVARVVGKNGLPVWVPYTQEDIDCDADFEVEGGSTMPHNEAWRQQQAMQLLQAMGPMIGQVVDPGEIAKYVLQQFGIKSPEKFIMQGPPPGMDPSQGGPPPPGAGGPQGPPLGPPPSDDPMDPNNPNAPQPGQGISPDQGGGIPPEILAQLQGQVGLNTGA